jgi:integrase
VHGTKRDAEHTLREIQYSLDKGTYAKPNRVTVGDFLKEWCESYVAINTSRRTYESYRSNIYCHLIPALGMIPLSQLEPQHIQTYYANALLKGRADGKGGLSARSVLYHHRLLSKALNYAVRMGKVVRNVTEAVDTPRVNRVQMSTLAPQDIPTFLEVARETPYFVLFCLLIYCGLRRGEALALKWKNVDTLGSELQVVASAHTLSDGTYVIKEPKTSHSRRTVSLPPSLTILLRQYKEDQRKLFNQMGGSLSDDDFVFSKPDGSPLDPNVVTHNFTKVVKRAGLPHIRLHDLRHTHATLMLKAGVHPKIVSERLGHANISITLDTYSHVLPGLQEAAAERFDKLLNDSSFSQNEDINVSKMLATDDGVESRPCRDRTCDHLIKSQMLYQLS